MRRLVDKMTLSQIWPEHMVQDLPHKVFLTIDSRVVEKGDVFFALKGEFKDGHDFIDKAHQQGASLIIAEERCNDKLDPSLPVMFVKDSLETFSKIAHLHLKALNPTTIAITGSNGKTTTKEMVKAVVSEALGEDQVYASQGNKNNHFGVPLSALEVTAAHKIAIFEMGMNHAGEISALCAIVEPDIGLITNIGHAHEGNFADGITGVAEAKGELFKSLLERNGVAIVNLDDERVVAMADKWSMKRRKTFGFNKHADIAVRSEKNPDDALSQKLSLSTPEGLCSCVVPLLGEHNALNAAAALAVANALNLPLHKACLGLIHMKKTAGRLLVHHTSTGYTLIDDGYNANPTSMAAGIKASLSLHGARRIAVIGAMGELGLSSPSHHTELGKLLAQHFDFLYLCGPDTKYALEGALHEGFTEANILYKDTSVLLIEPLLLMIRPGDLVYVKGSLSANMKVVVDALKA